MSGALDERSALVLVPSRKVWAPIQAIRRAHDRRVRRWMPHVTLMHPFHAQPLADTHRARLDDACRRVESFRVTLGGFSFFRHRPNSHTIWLAPRPPEAIGALYASLAEAFPECARGARGGRAFVPHLSVAQARGPDEREALLERLRARWRPVRFTVHEVALLARDDPPDDVFEIARRIPLGPPIEA